MITVNLTGAFNAIWAVKNSMIARTFGRIVNVSSVAALLMLGRTMNPSLERSSVSVNHVMRQPGPHGAACFS